MSDEDLHGRVIITPILQTTQMVHLCSLFYCAAEYVDGNLKSKQKAPEKEMINPFSQNVLRNSSIDKDIKTL